MEINEYIRKQFNDHKHFVASIKKAPSNSNESYHPRTGRRITFNEKCYLIDRDIEKRTKAILRKLS